MSMAPDDSGTRAAEPAGSADGIDAVEWLSIPEVAAALGVRDRDVRSMISDRSLLGIRREGRAPTVPAAFLVASDDGTTILPGLRGTLTLLGDAGYADEEIVGWMFRTNDELGGTPVEALVALRTHAVRRAAQALAF